MYAYHRPGPGGLPLGLASNEGLGLTAGDGMDWLALSSDAPQGQRLHLRPPAQRWVAGATEVRSVLVPRQPLTDVHHRFSSPSRRPRPACHRRRGVVLRSRGHLPLEVA